MASKYSQPECERAWSAIAGQTRRRSKAELVARKLIKQLLWSEPRLFWPVGRLLDARSVRSDDYDIVIDGFPRSGNTYASVAFRRTQPGVRLLSHRHMPVYIIQAIRRSKPVCVLVREPLLSISSWIMYSGLPVRDAIQDYILYYTPLVRHIDDVLVVHFNDVVSAFDRVVAAINLRFGTNYAVPSVTEHFKAEVETELRETVWTTDPLKLPLPTELRRTYGPLIKQLVAADENASLLREATDLYSVFSAHMLRIADVPLI